MSKKISFGTKPSNKPADAPLVADAWVENRGAEVMKRLTIDIPEGLHRSIKAQCATRGTKIAEEVRNLLVKEFGGK